MSCIQSKNLQESIRGVWVPDPQYTDVLKTYKNVVNFVSTLDSLNFNSIYVVSYALSKTIYPSAVLLSNTNYAHIDSTNMLAPFRAQYNVPMKSPTGDPVKDLITEAHKRNIKVFFWYEFGFMADIKLATPENNPILAKNPKWVGIGNDNKPANYNNHDYYFNAFDPDVQQYILDLISEGIKRYPNVDGIQGDDRLPAMCINSGYDVKTIEKYKSEHNGQIPPENFKDSAWVRWRLDILNTFGETLYNKVKSIDPKIMVSFAPNPYPWCKDNLMQEWPQWVSDGICDLLAVQCYRTDSLSYRNTVSQAQSFIKPPIGKKQLFVPGIILMVSGEISDANELKKQVLINRDLKTNGEIFFYNEGLRKPEIIKVIKELYPEKAVFPKL
ncbi:MAG: family 10 glycosylhydrolase [Paludibacter sp.]|nr:family 10 glycosylhydrolase [Paludibacter sp.]